MSRWSGTVAPSRSRQLLLRVLRDPAALERLESAELDLVLRVLRPPHLLGRMEVHATSLGLALPQPVADRFEAARHYIGRIQVRTRFELDCVVRVLGPLAEGIVLLKGCAYLMTGHPVHVGRYLADVDLLVARDRLAAVEERLVAHGWEALKVSDYDQGYYRNWMHELPPMAHPERGVEMDLHHTISPVSGRLKVDGAALLARSRPVPGTPFRVLAPEDMVLHAIVHLFQDGEIFGAVNQLLDIHQLLDSFSDEPSAWERLVPRATELGLGRPLYYALRYARRLLRTAVPAEVAVAAEAFAPPAPVGLAMDTLVERSLCRADPDRVDPLGPLCLWMLQTRSHWLRMPPLMLARHLSYKAWLRATGKLDDDPRESPA
jgi:hypothetical protein